MLYLYLSSGQRIVECAKQTHYLLQEIAVLTHGSQHAIPASAIQPVSNKQGTAGTKPAVARAAAEHTLPTSASTQHPDKQQVVNVQQRAHAGPSTSSGVSPAASVSRPAISSSLPPQKSAVPNANKRPTLAVLQIAVTQPHCIDTAQSTTEVDCSGASLSTKKVTVLAEGLAKAASHAALEVVLPVATLSHLPKHAPAQIVAVQQLVSPRSDSTATLATVQVSGIPGVFRMLHYIASARTAHTVHFDKPGSRQVFDSLQAERDSESVSSYDIEKILDVPPYAGQWQAAPIADSSRRSSSVTELDDLLRVSPMDSEHKSVSIGR